MTRKELDLIGEVCPYPLLQTQKEMGKLGAGETLVIKTDFNQSVRNILKWCEDRDYEFSLDEVENGLWEITITK